MTTLILVMKRSGNIRVMQQVLAPEGFSVIGVSTREALEPALAEAPEACLGLVDVTGFGPDVWGICEALHTRGVRFVVLSTPQQTKAGGRALGCGAASFLEKPVGKSALLQLLKGLAN